MLSVILGFAGGFLVANALNRTELSTLRSENERLKQGGDQSADASGPQSELSPDEIRQRITEADSNPTDFEYQRNLGLALYRYAAFKQDTELLGQAARLLGRAHSLKSEDYDVIVGLGNANFDIGYYKKENKPLESARIFYAKALAIKPDDADVRTDVGLTYFLEDPPKNEEAIAEFKRSLESDPKHEKTLGFLIQTLVRQKKTAEAGQYLEQLKQINPSSQGISELAAVVSGEKPPK